MALKLPAREAAEVAIRSIGRGYDITEDLRLRYCKGGAAKGPDRRLIEIDDDSGRDIVLPGGVSVSNVSRSIKCDKGDLTRFRSDVLPFQEMSVQFNLELSLTGKIPSGLFNSMFEFSGSWQTDAANTQNLAFDGVFITLYTVALDKSHIVLRENVRKAVPASWDPAALASWCEDGWKGCSLYETAAFIHTQTRRFAAKVKRYGRQEICGQCCTKYDEF